MDKMLMRSNIYLAKLKGGEGGQFPSKPIEFFSSQISVGNTTSKINKNIITCSKVYTNCFLRKM